MPRNGKDDVKKADWFCKHAGCVDKKPTFGWKVNCHICGSHKGTCRARDVKDADPSKRTVAAQQVLEQKQQARAAAKQQGGQGDKAFQAMLDSNKKKDKQIDQMLSELSQLRQTVRTGPMDIHDPSTDKSSHDLHIACVHRQIAVLREFAQSDPKAKEQLGILQLELDEHERTRRESRPPFEKLQGACKALREAKKAHETTQAKLVKDQQKLQEAQEQIATTQAKLSKQAEEIRQCEERHAKASEENETALGCPRSRPQAAQDLQQAAATLSADELTELGISSELCGSVVEKLLARISAKKESEATKEPEQNPVPKDNPTSKSPFASKEPPQPPANPFMDVGGDRKRALDLDDIGKEFLESLGEVEGVPKDKVEGFWQNYVKKRKQHERHDLLEPF